MNLLQYPEEERKLRFKAWHQIAHAKELGIYNKASKGSNKELSDLITYIENLNRKDYSKKELIKLDLCIDYFNNTTFDKDVSLPPIAEHCSGQDAIVKSGVWRQIRFPRIDRFLRFRHP